MADQNLPRDPALSVSAVIVFFEQLRPDDLQRLGQFYAAQALFKDPFNEVTGLAAIEEVFRHMFQALEQPRFRITTQVLQGRQCFLTWDFLFRFKGIGSASEQVVHGATHVVFDEQGLIVLHRDYWDAAEELYEKLPLLGSLMRWLKRRARG